MTAFDPGNPLAGLTASQIASLISSQVASLISSLSPRSTVLSYIISGFTLPNSGSLTNNIGSGDASINGLRVILPTSTPVTFPTNSDCYVDLNQSGQIAVVSVANGATTGMNLAANSIRLGKVITGASAITGVTAIGKDPLNNPLRNISPRPSCILVNTNLQSSIVNIPLLVAFNQAASYDNAYMHSATSNVSHITINHEGLYQVAMGFTTLAVTTPTQLGGLRLKKSGVYVGTSPQELWTPGNTYQGHSVSGPVACLVGDYLEMEFDAGGPRATLSNAWFSATCLSTGA